MSLFPAVTPSNLIFVITDPDPTKSQVSAILSGLGITTDDLARLLMPPPPAAPPVSINISDLSRLYRNVSMARWLQLDIKSFLALQSPIAMQPFGSVGSSCRFLKTVARLRASGFSLTELRYLLGGQIADGAPSSFVATDDQAKDFGTQVRALLAPMPADIGKRQDAVVAKVAASLILFLQEVMATHGTFCRTLFWQVHLCFRILLDICEECF